MTKITTLMFALLSCVMIARTQTSQPPQPSLTLQQYLEQFFLMVAPIEGWSGATRLETATGFFFTNDNRLYLVTNRHVVRNDQNRFFPDKLSIHLHTNRQDNTQNADYDIPLYRNKTSVWREKAGVDLVAIEIPTNDMSKFVIVAISPTWLPPEKLAIAPGDDVMIIGYPLGFSDSLHNYPVVRTGAVASAYPVPFQGQPYFLVDARLHPGTSGSPVLTKPSSIQRTSTGINFGDTTVYFLGVNSGEYNLNGVSSELNLVWYASEVKAITDTSFQTVTSLQP